jgi:hypothetical protein
LSGDGKDRRRCKEEIFKSRQLKIARKDAKGTGRREKLALKNFGDAVRVPVVALQQVLSASCCFSSLLSFWLPWIYSPFPFFMEFCNGRLLQLIECIESTQNEVKRKMIELSVLQVAPKSPRVNHVRKNCDAITLQFRRALAAIMFCRSR